MPSSIEMSAPRQAEMSLSDRIHAENVQQYHAHMAEYNSSCCRKTANNLGLAALVVGCLDATVAAPILSTKASGLVTGLVGGVGTLACCLLGGLAIQMAERPDEPIHPDHRETTVYAGG